MGHEPHSKQRISEVVLLKCTKMRSSGTTAYDPGDCINEYHIANLPSPWSFYPATQFDGWGGILTRAFIIDSANQTTKADLELWLFDDEPEVFGDGAAFNPSDLFLQEHLVEIVEFPDVFVGGATAGAAGNCVYKSDQLAIAYQVSDQHERSRTLYGVLVVRNAYTPVSNEVFTVVLEVLRS